MIRILKCVALQHISEFQSNEKNVIYTSSEQVLPQITWNNVMERKK